MCLATCKSVVQKSFTSKTQTGASGGEAFSTAERHNADSLEKLERMSARMVLILQPSEEWAYKVRNPVYPSGTRRQSVATPRREQRLCIACRSRNLLNPPGTRVTKWRRAQARPKIPNIAGLQEPGCSQSGTRRILRTSRTECLLAWVARGLIYINKIRPGRGQE